MRNLILDNIIFSLQMAGGVSIVWENLIQGVQGKIPTSYIEYQGASNNIHRNRLEINKSEILQKRSVSLKLEQFLHPKVIMSEPFIFHSSYYRTCKNPKACNITTVHDFIYEMAQSNLTLSQKIRCALTHRAIRESDYIICISENTKNDMLKLLPEVKHKPIEVIYNGVSDEYYPITQNDSQFSDYLLYVGGRQDYKNFSFSVEAAATCNQKLIICGNDLTANEYNLLNKSLGEDNYRIKVRPTNAELNVLYNSAKALIYPSSYEGFGIPIIEAQKAGCPVIAYNSSSIPEIIGETPLLLNDLSISSFRIVMAILENSANREAVIESGLTNSQRFSWEKMSKSYLDLYNSIK